MGLILRIRRRMTLEEIEQGLQDLEREQGLSFDEFEELFWENKLDRNLVDVYAKWAELIHAYRGYVEAGELDYTVEENRDLELEEIELLTPKRLQLLYDLASMRPESINDLARKTSRNVKNVYEDLKALKSLGFVTFKKRGRRNVVPETLVEEITLLIR